ncbi:MAG: PEP-CTERM sorting domain-containing protein, partial [Verrucomicrobiota bacterium]
TNVNGLLGTAPGAAAVTVAAGASLKFGTISQTLASLDIGAGSTVTFMGGSASGSFTSSDGGSKAPSFGAAVVPEPGTFGLLLVGALGMLNRRRRQA